MILCRTVTAHHTDAREGTLTALARVGYRVHMSVCPFCRAYAKGLEQAVAALGTLPEPQVPDALKAGAVARLRARANRAPRD